MPGCSLGLQAVPPHTRARAHLIEGSLPTIHFPSAMGTLPTLTSWKPLAPRVRLKLPAGEEEPEGCREQGMAVGGAWLVPLCADACKPCAGVLEQCIVAEKYTIYHRANTQELSKLTNLLTQTYCPPPPHISPHLWPYGHPPCCQNPAAQLHGDVDAQIADGSALNEVPRAQIALAVEHV